MRFVLIFALALAGVFLVDQAIKELFVDGYFRAGECIDLKLRYNKGIAWSMFAFLGGSLKWIHALFVAFVAFVALKRENLQKYALFSGVLVGSAFSNLFDRFTKEGVVDYVAWHCGFDYPVFNLADVLILISMASILFIYYKTSKE